MKKLAIFIVLAVLLMLCAAPVYAQSIPPLPHAFYGSVTIDGDPAPAGTEVEARGEGVATGIADNPTITAVRGIYGTSNPFEHRLIVQGNIDDGATITFYVNGYSTGQTAEWHSGETTPLDLSVTIAAPPEGRPGGGPGPPPSRIETTLFGVEEEFRISDEGEILETIEATSADGMLTITIPEGTIALDKEGEPLSSLTVDVDPSPPDPPEDAYIIGLAYDFGPAGATFDPAITFTWSYDPADIPVGVAEEDLVIAYYNEVLGEWVELPCEVDRPPLTASVSHFTTFAIIGAVPPPPPPAPAAFLVSELSIKPAEVQPKESVTITVSVANTGGMEGSYTVVLLIKGVKEAEKSVTVAAGESQLVSFIVAKEKAGSYSITVDGLSGSFMVVAPPPPPPPPPPIVPPEVKPPINWPLIGGIIAAVVVVGLLIFFLVRRRAY